MATDFAVFPSITFVDLGLYQFGKESCCSAHSFGPAIRNHYLFHYILRGCGSLIWQDSKGATHTQTLRARQGFLLFPGQITTYIADVDNPWEYCWLEFDGLKAGEFIENTGLSVDHPVYNAVHKDQEILMRNEMLYIVDHKKETPYHLIGHLYIFIDAMVRSVFSKPVSLDNLKDFYIQEALSFIETHYMEDISIEDIAESSGLNRSYFGKIFRESVGKTPQEFLISYRMAKACTLLKMTRYSIGKIGAAIGYPNQLHFSRAFKNVYGISPKSWRNNQMTEGAESDFVTPVCSK